MTSARQAQNHEVVKLDGWDWCGEEGRVAHQRPWVAFQCVEVFPIHQLLGVVLLLRPPFRAWRLVVREHAPDAAQTVGARPERLGGFKERQEPPGETRGVCDRKPIRRRAGVLSGRVED